MLGRSEGLTLGYSVGATLGMYDGRLLGSYVGTTDGWRLGCKVGGEDGRSEYDGFDVGALTGLVVGRKSHMDSTRTPTKSFKSLKLEIT